MAVAEGAEVADLLELRRIVFVDEQGVDAEAEIDGRDEHAVHLAARRAGRLVGTLRLLRDGDTVRVQRVAVLREQRRSGAGAVLMRRAEELARGWGARQLLLHAQRASEAFYAAQGYTAEGETFFEEGIEHVAMRRVLA